MIIGGGVSGLAAANALGGVDLMVLEAGVPLEATSGRITSMGESSIGPPTVGSTRAAMDRMLARIGLGKTSSPPAIVRRRDGSCGQQGHAAPLSPLHSSEHPCSLVGKLRVMLEPLILGADTVWKSRWRTSCAVV